MNRTQAAAPEKEGSERGEQWLDRVRTRVSEAPLRQGNRIALLKNGPEAYEEWLDEIARAERWVHLENYIFKSDETGRRFAAALKQKANEGVPTRLLYDWWGSLETPSALFADLRQAGVDVRAFNPFSLAVPLEVALRDHRKSLSVDGTYASVGGICIADEWVARSPETGLPYRDTAVSIRGPAVLDVGRAFAQVWRRCGDPLPAWEQGTVETVEPAGDEAARVVIQEPGRMRIARFLQLVAAGATQRLWIADAYFMAGPSLNQALISAARDGVDVRLLLPATPDVPMLSTVSRSGYRRLLEAGVRVFEYGGLMMHAKTSVADGFSSRVGSTNLNVTGLLTDWELDVIVESEEFGAKMERMYEDDLADSREMMLGGTPQRRKAEPTRDLDRPGTRSGWPVPAGSMGSGSRAMVTAARAGAAAFGGSADELRRNERAASVAISGALLGTAILGARFPRVLAWPVAAVGGLLGGSGLLRLSRRAKGGASSATRG